MKTICIDGEEYEVVRKVDSKMRDLSRKCNSGCYIALCTKDEFAMTNAKHDAIKVEKYDLLKVDGMARRAGKDRIVFVYSDGNRFMAQENNNYKLIHKDHEDALRAHLFRTDVHIEFDQGDGIWWRCDGDDWFIRDYKEHWRYRIEPKKRFPVFKRNRKGEILRYDNEMKCTYVLSPHRQGKSETYSSSDSFLCFEETKHWSTVYYSDRFMMYRGQPAWYADHSRRGVVRIGLFDPEAEEENKNLIE